MAATEPPLVVQPLTGHIGAEIHGLDLARHLDGAQFAALSGALREHQVVFVPGQNVGPARLLEIGERFGDILRNPTSPKAEGFPDVTELITRDGRAPDIWHFDTSYSPVPPKLSLLSMVKSPAVGGDTLFISSYAVYESLSGPMQEFLQGLSARYDSATRGVPGHVADHPIVHVHPETRRPCLHFDPMYASKIVELNPAESDAVLAFLRSYIADPTFACRYRWSEGALAIWDNRCTMHRVASDFIGERIIQRVTIAGEN